MPIRIPALKGCVLMAAVQPTHLSRHRKKLLKMKNPWCKSNIDERRPLITCLQLHEALWELISDLFTEFLSPFPPSLICWEMLSGEMEACCLKNRQCCCKHCWFWSSSSLLLCLKETLPHLHTLCTMHRAVVALSTYCSTPQYIYSVFCQLHVLDLLISLDPSLSLFIVGDLTMGAGTRTPSSFNQVVYLCLLAQFWLGAAGGEFGRNWIH